MSEGLLQKDVTMVGRRGSGRSVPTFIITTPDKQSIEDQRVVIRSHAVRGTRRKRLPSRPSSWMSDGGHPDDEAILNEEKACSVPHKIGGEFALVSFPVVMTHDMYQCIWHLITVVKQAMFPLDLGPAFAQIEPPWLEHIFQDPASLHGMVYSTKFYLDHVSHATNNRASAAAHLAKILKILQHRLLGDDSRISPTSNSTIFVVMGLAMSANFAGDSESARHHLKGLHKMVTLRGGLSAFKSEALLQTKICRADIGLCVSTGCSPLFFSDSISWEPYLPSPASKPRRSRKPPKPESDLDRFCRGLDARLRPAWSDLSEFTRAVNIANQCKLDIDLELYYEVMASIHYRLLNLHFDNDDVNEAIRLALLAFATTLFLQWRDVKLPCKHLSQSFRDTLSALDTSTLPVSLAIWLHTVGVVCVFDTDTGLWFQEALVGVLRRNPELNTWHELRTVVKSVIWVDTLHDSTARSAIEAALSETWRCSTETVQQQS